jgi:ABC-2 type transport system permease protein
MKNFLYQVGINYKRVILRNKSFLTFAIGFPVGFYLLFGKAMISSMQIPASYLATWQADYLVSMVVYSSLITSLSSLPSTLNDDREHQFTLFVRLSGSRQSRYYTAMLAVFMPLAMLIVLVLGLVAIAVNQVQITALMWLTFLVIMPFATLPLILLGILISYTVRRANTISIVGQLLSIGGAVFSGLWTPINYLPSWMQAVGEHLPPYYIQNVIIQVIHKEGHNFSNHLLTGTLGNSVTGLVVWTLLLGLLIVAMVLFQRRREVEMI